MSASSIFSFRGRLLRKVVAYKNDLLAVSDLAFYLIVGAQRKVYRRGTLADLIRDRKTNGAELVTALVERIRSLDIPRLAAALNAMYSDSLAEKLFTEAVRVMDIDEFVAYIVEYGRRLSGPFAAVTGCQVPKGSEAPPAIIYAPFASIIRLLNLLRINTSFGLRGNTPCIVVDENSGSGIAIAEETR